MVVEPIVIVVLSLCHRGTGLIFDFCSILHVLGGLDSLIVRETVALKHLNMDDEKKRLFFYANKLETMKTHFCVWSFIAVWIYVDLLGMGRIK